MKITFAPMKLPPDQEAADATTASALMAAHPDPQTLSVWIDESGTRWWFDPVYGELIRVSS